MNEKTLVIDSNYICYVNKYAYTMELTYRGEETSIIFGFLKNVLTLAKRFETKKMIFCWDSRKSLRKEIYPDYKSNRHENKTAEQKEQDAIAYKQFDKLRQTILPKLGFKRNYMIDGLESDDIIASVVMNGNDKYVIISSDRDLYQLLDYAPLYNVVKSSLTTKAEFEREYKIKPKQWAEMLAISGCHTDNVKGVSSGIGPVTAIRYITGTLPKTHNKYPIIENNKDIIRRNLKLVKLPFDNSLTFNDYIPSEIFYKKDFKEIFNEYGFESLLDSHNEKFGWNSWKKTFGLV